MKKRALSLLLCLLMIGTLLGTGMPAYASVVIDRELTFIDSTTGETSTDAPEESEGTEAIPDGESTEGTEAEAEESSAVEEATEVADAESAEGETAEIENLPAEADIEADEPKVDDSTGAAAEAEASAELEEEPEALSSVNETLTFADEGGLVYYGYATDSTDDSGLSTDNQEYYMTQDGTEPIRVYCINHNAEAPYAMDYDTAKRLDLSYTKEIGSQESLEQNVQENKYDEDLEKNIRKILYYLYDTGAPTRLSNKLVWKVSGSKIALQPEEEELYTSIIAGAEAPDNFVVDLFVPKDEAKQTLARGYIDETMEDEKVEVEFSKVKLGGEELPGARIEIYKGDAKVEQWTSLETSTVIKLEPGTYRFHEEAAPEGFVAVTDFEFTVEADGSVTLGTIAQGETVVAENGKITVTDNAKTNPPAPDDEKVEVEFSKVKLGGEELPGARIEIYKGDAKVEQWTSQETSTVIKLEAGTYRFHEEAAPEGFVAVTDFEFTVEADGSVTLGKIAQGETVVAENGKITVTDNAKTNPPTPDDEKVEVEFSKVKLGGEELPGARIEIYKGDAKVEQWTSLETSTVIELEPGTYRFHEEAAPEGFVAVTDFEFTVEADGSVTLGTIAQGETVVAENGKITITDNAATNPSTPEEKTGSLAVTKKVSGSGGDQNKEFTFTVTLDKQDLNGQYGDMTFTNGVSTFTLKHGQSKTATGLPTGVSYTVEESDNSGYTVTKTNASGTIQTGSTATVTFENYKGSSGGSGGGGGGGSSSHTPQPARVTLTATKTMDGLIPTGSGFTFFLDDANGQRLQVKNNQGGNITFDTLTFDKTGTYVYYLMEQTGNDKNVNYDTSSYKVTVTVTCPYDYAASVSYEKKGQAYNSVPAFANTTKPSAPAPTPTQTPPVVTPARPLDNVPKTEDSSNLALWCILAVASLLSLIVLLAGNKARKGCSQSKENKR